MANISLPDGFSLLAQSHYAPDAFQSRHKPTCHHITSADVLAVAGETPWHGIGYHVPDRADLTVRAAKLFTQNRNPVIVPLRDVLGPDYRADITARAIVGHDKRVLGTCSPQFTLMTWAEILDGIGLISGHGPDALLETLGSMNGGRTRFASWVHHVATPPVPDARSGVVSYGIFTESTANRGAAYGAIAGNRVVCRNTERLALRTAEEKLTIRHNADIRARWQTVCRQFADMRAAAERQADSMHELHDYDMTAGEVAYFLDAVMPPVADSDRAAAALAREREKLTVSLLTSPGGASAYGATGYTIWQGLTHFLTQDNAQTRVKGEGVYRSQAEQEADRAGRVLSNTLHDNRYAHGFSVLADMARSKGVLTLA